MSEHTNPSVVNKSSRPLVGILTLLGLLLLGVVTAAAIRHNPLYSDREAYGISKYQFIETCKEHLDHPADLTLGVPGQKVKLADLTNQLKTTGSLKAGEHLNVRTNANSATLVNGVQHVDTGKIGLIIPVLIEADSGDQQRVLGPANLQCVHDKAKNTTETTLSVGQ